MPVAVNEVLYVTSISFNRVFVFEFVKCLCIGAPPKDPAQKRFVVLWDFRETREVRSQTTTVVLHSLLPLVTMVRLPKKVGVRGRAGKRASVFASFLGAVGSWAPFISSCACAPYTMFSPVALRA